MSHDINPDQALVSAGCILLCGFFPAALGRAVAYAYPPYQANVQPGQPGFRRPGRALP